MKLELQFAAASCLAALLALAAPASAATFSYNLSGDTTTAYSYTNDPGYSYIDLTDTNTGASLRPSYTLSTGDTVQITLNLNNPVTLSNYYIYLQDVPGMSELGFDTTYSYFDGGTLVTTPTLPTPGWSYIVGSGGAFLVGGGYDSDTFTFDQVVVTAVITGMSGGGFTLPESWSWLGMVNADLATRSIAPTPLPGGLLLMMTALGGLGFFARRKRQANIAA